MLKKKWDIAVSAIKTKLVLLHKAFFQDYDD